MTPLPVRRWRAGAWQDIVDNVAAEVPVALSYNSIPHVVMMATPLDLEDMGVGFTVSEGLVADYSELRGVALDVSSGEYELRLSVDGIAAGRDAATGAATSPDGRAAASVGRKLSRTPSASHRPWPRAARPPREQLVGALRRMRALQPLGALAGSLHAAAWVDWSGEVRLVREDVGRHNALDKLIGAKLRAGDDLADGYVMVTSRASYEMVQKTATLGIRMLVAVSAPTALGVELARECGLTLVGFAREEQQVVYSRPERLRQ